MKMTACGLGHDTYCDPMRCSAISQGANAMKFQIAQFAAVAIAAIGLSIGSASAGGSYNQKDIVDTAVQAGQFKTLAKALDAAGLIPTLKGPGPFTVFAPTDAAFAKLPEGTLENLLKPENREQLRAILTYHVVPGRLMASDVAGLDEVKTVNGKMLSISTHGKAVMIDNANVTSTDIKASNGVIHVIDTVLMPPED
jgi:uncharacterized surface protein with fasciclin (FAS1) repeats